MSTDTGRGPGIHQRMLIGRLTALRHARGLTQLKVARTLEWSHAKMLRYEGGAQPLTKTALDALLIVYGVADTRQGKELRALGEAARAPAWWHPYRHLLTPHQRTVIGVESGADTIRQVATTVVPDLLQTRRYAKCVTALEAAPDAVDPLVDVLMRHQSTVNVRTPRPQQRYLLCEAVLSIHVGVAVDPTLMPSQLYHLVNLARDPAVQIRVLPASRGEHAAVLAGPFTLLGFDKDTGLDEVFHARAHHMSQLTDKPSEMGHYGVWFEQAWELALHEHASAQLIHEHAHALHNRAPAP